ncbi:MAG: hypothetical protein SVM79_08755 [Chloroflexota bacterium]|nr:hypothetical protein [Chloroflexota bacterium]
MRRRNKSDCPHPIIENTLNTVNDLCQSQPIRRFTLGVATDLIVLAKNTLHIAVGKKEVTYPVWTGDYRLLATVGENGTDAESGTTPAVAKFICGTFAVAIPGATDAIREFALEHKNLLARVKMLQREWKASRGIPRPRLVVPFDCETCQRFKISPGR